MSYAQLQYNKALVNQPPPPPDHPPPFNALPQNQPPPPPPHNYCRGNYSNAKLNHSMTIMYKILPIGPDEWDNVNTHHKTKFPGRDVA